MAVLLFFLLCVLRRCCATEYTSLEFDYSTDIAEVPSRALLASINVGVPAQSRTLMVDFESDDIELVDCLRSSSYTYDTLRESDVVLFEEERITDSRARASFRMSIRQHCEDVGKLSERFYANCLGEHCQGVLGLSRRSPFWQIWPAYTLGLDGLKLGNDHPRHEPDIGRVVKCDAATRGVCQFRALVADDTSGQTYTVRIHAENSYTFLPTELYERLAGETLASLDILDASHERRHPLLMRLDRALLLHTPGTWLDHSATQRSSSTLFFSQHSAHTDTLLAKPWANETTISIGNSALLRYTFHVDLARNEMAIELRLRNEHMGVVSIVFGLALFFALVRSVSLSNNELSWLVLGNGIVCSCHHGKTHTAPEAALVHWLGAFGVFLCTVYAVAFGVAFIDAAFDAVWIVLAVTLNWVLLAMQIAASWHYQRTIHGYSRSRSQLERVFVFSLLLETTALLALLLVVLVVRQDSLGTAGTAFVALAIVFNGWRYAHVAIISARTSVAMALLVLVDGVVLPALASARIVADFVLSWPLTATLVVGAVVLASLSVSANVRLRAAFLLVGAGVSKLQ